MSHPWEALRAATCRDASVRALLSGIVAHLEVAALHAPDQLAGLIASLRDAVPSLADAADHHRTSSQLQTLILERIDTMTLDLTKLAASVARVETVDAAIVALCDGISGQLKALAAAAPDLATLQAQLDAFAGRLGASSDKVAADVTANTPAAPAPTAAPAGSGGAKS
jgi:hypothetical protein